jgi:hypothetical protein
VSTESESVEPEDESAIILAHLISERTDDHRPQLAVHEVALLRMAALILASGDTGKAREVSDLLERAPRITNPGRKPPPSLRQVCADDAQLDISRLSNADLVELERLHAVMAGRAVPLPNERIESALALAWLLDGADGEPDIGRVRELVVEVVGAELVARVFPDGRDELAAERQRRLAVEEELKRAQHALDLAAQALPANVVRLRREQQA